MSNVPPMWDHQVDAVKASQVIPDFGLLFEQGTGKSRTLIEILRRIYAAAGHVRKTFIVAPPIVLFNWKREFQMYSKINPNDVVVLYGSEKKRIQTLLKECGDDLSRNKIVITNYEAMQMKDLRELLFHWNPRILALDESQRVKNHESVRAKELVKFADRTDHNFILTGTPILNTPADIYMQYRILDRGALFGKNFYSFRANYFVDENCRRKGTQGYFPKWVCLPNKYAELQHRMFTKAMRVLKKDCLDLPPLVRQEVHVELSAEQKRMYKEMYHEYVTFIANQKKDNPVVVAQLAVTKMLRLQQIVSGFAKDEEGNVHRIDCPRLKALEELLEDILSNPENKVIVWSVFKENYKMIAEVCERLKIGYAQLHGELSTTEKRDEVKKFREEENCRVMIANQGAGGVGINLVEANYAIYYSKGYKLEDDLQSEARNHRGGSEVHEKVTRIDLVALGTCDELVTKALNEKQNVADQILEWKGALCQL